MSDKLSGCISDGNLYCILASYIAYRSSNKTQFCSMIIHVHHKSDLSEGSDEFAHFARIQKVLPEGVRL